MVDEKLKAHVEIANGKPIGYMHNLGSGRAATSGIPTGKLLVKQIARQQKSAEYRARGENPRRGFRQAIAQAEVNGESQ